MYKIRLKLSAMFFRWGKTIHPDLARLKREIMIQQELLGINKLKVK